MESEKKDHKLMDSNVESNTGCGEEVTREKLDGDLKTLAEDAEELLKATAGDLGEKAKEARVRLTAALEKAKETYQIVQDQAVAGAKATEQCIRDHPYPAVGFAFALGLVFGLLIKRR
jgi:ElaB/YqjD/DUF883 family membrane-anchored ribosome-binding protein